MTSAAILEKIEQLPARVRDDLEDYIELLHQKYAMDAEEEDELERTPDGDVIIGYDVDETPLLASVAKEEFRKRIQSMDQGNYITIEQLRQESKTW